MLMDKADIVKGFNLLCNQIRVQKDILSSLDQYTFDKRASESGLETYIINDLRTIWKNRRLETLQKSLVQRDIKYNKPNKEHPLYKCFVKYLEDTYRNGVDRFKTFICIGDTYIGKSVFFTKFIVPEKYYIYHSNYLEFSKMSNQPMKIFRIMDDINWDDVRLDKDLIIAISERYQELLQELYSTDNRIESLHLSEEAREIINDKANLWLEYFLASSTFRDPKANIFDKMDSFIKTNKFA